MLKLESARHPMHIASLQVFSPPPAAGADFAQQIYAAMLECTDVARVFRGHPKITRRGTSPVQWAYDERVDLGDHLKLVSLLGGMTRRYVTTPFDVIHRLAEKTNAAAYVLPLPFLANTPGDRKVLLEQRGVADVFELGVESTLRLVGIGAIDDQASILSTGLVERHEFDEARALGAVGELLGHFFSSRGDLIESGVSARALSMSTADIQRSATIAVAGGKTKIDAIRGVLASGLLHGLITDENTARSLVD